VSENIPPHFLENHYGKEEQKHLRQKFFMKKLTSYLPVFAIAVMSAVTAYSQKEPPPPPPPPKVIMKHPGAVTVKEFYKLNPSVSKVYAIEDKEIMIVLKDGTKEKYDIKNETEKRDFLNKYRKMPLLPPPPPPPPSKEII
jgi:hypothetical protein